MSQSQQETYSPWTVVSVVFAHLVDQGLHPVLGEAGNPGDAATDLLRAFGIAPTVEGNARIAEEKRQHLADLRAAVMDEP